MKKKFEIRSHDGPGRIGKIDSEPTPKFFFKNDLKIAPNQGSAHNVDREIAEFNVKETLRLAEENVDEFLKFRKRAYYMHNGLGKDETYEAALEWLGVQQFALVELPESEKKQYLIRLFS